MSDLDLVQKLREIENLKSGSPLPDWMSEGGKNNWGAGLSKLCGQAADRISELEREQSQVSRALAELGELAAEHEEYFGDGNQK